jgi:hypothetical protein
MNLVPSARVIERLTVIVRCPFMPPDCIQSRSMDTLLRVFLAFPSVRKVLATPPQSSELGLQDLNVADAEQQSIPR